MHGKINAHICHYQCLRESVKNRGKWRQREREENLGSMLLRDNKERRSIVGRKLERYWQEKVSLPPFN